MLRGRWLGRRRWQWAADGVLVVLVIVVLISAESPLTRMAMVLVLITRALSAGLIVYSDRARRRVTDVAVDDDGGPRRG